MGITKHRYSAGAEAEWLALRGELIRSGRLGGSMIGVAAGVSPYKSPVRLWAEMKGLIVEEEKTSEAIRDGHDHEDYVAKRFEELSGKEVHRENCIFVNDEYPHLFASIDRKIANEESGLECKTANAYMQSRFTDTEFPKAYYAQVCSYLAVTGLKRWYLCVWCMGIFVKCYLLTTVAEDMDNPPSWCVGVFYVSPDELEACESIAANFINSLEYSQPPMIDGSDDTSDVLGELYPISNGQTIELGDGVDCLLGERAELKSQIDKLDERIGEIENQIKAALACCEVGTTANYKVSYKSVVSRRLDRELIKAACGGTIPDSYYKTSEGRTLRITAAKKAKKA